MRYSLALKSHRYNAVNVKDRPKMYKSLKCNCT